MESTARLEEIRRAIEKAARYLPAQGPIDIFVAQNILGGFEDEPFEQAVVSAARLYGTQPFLPESRYRAEMALGRIEAADLAAVLAADLGPQAAEPLAGGRITLGTLFRKLLDHPVRQEDDVAVRWTLSESDAIESEAEADRWLACMEAAGLARPGRAHVRPPVRLRDLVMAVDPAVDADEFVHPLLIRLAAAFLDQGVAAWPMPGRERGFLAAVGDLYASRLGPTEPWSARLPESLAAAGKMPAFEVIDLELDRLGVPSLRREECIVRSLLALRGWAGMFRHFEERPDRVPVEAVPARLADFLAVRLVCERVVAEWLAPRFGAGDLAALTTELYDRHPACRPPGTVARAFLFWQVAGIVGLSAADVRALDENEIIRLESAITGFDGFTRRRLFHLAYERRYRQTVLDALEEHAASPARPATPPRVQAIFCMDERCESLRRHLEEQGPGFETFGTAGFFAVPMYYRGLDDWHTIPLCPIVMRPRHTVVEAPEAEAVARHRRWQAVRRHVGRVRGTVASGSRELVRGGLLTAVGGALAAVPLVARVAFPWLTSRVSERTAGLVRGGIATRLLLERADEPPLPDGTQAGFDVDEMVGIVRRVLEDIGLTSGFAPLVAVLGHGSTSLNNPHESAYDCGACGGGRGGPNARAFATMANDLRVRARLAAEGLAIPETTHFVGGMHDTCSNGIVLYDAAAIPAVLADHLAVFRAAYDRARGLDAVERCRRFDTVPPDVGPAAALRHVEGRAGDLAQVRPEYGHATNALCIVGRRDRTRGLFLDRRAFLVSYDPSTDADGGILARTLAAVGPVGAGINLAYLFSCVDPQGYGCGTKLPHNITGLIGVMDGHASDLRTGLPWQTVEIHEPLRLLLVVDAPVERIAAAIERVPPVARLVANGWVQLAAWDPDGVEVRVLEAGAFVRPEREPRLTPVVERSAEWFSGRRGHLPPARVSAGPGKDGGA
jgi:uncharacterized protein YbcC (UPF0753/DUF2309 family)